MILGPNCQQMRLTEEKEEDLVGQNTKIAIAHLPLYMWGQSGKLGETDYDDYDHTGVWLSCFNTSVSTNQNGVLVAYITEVQRQSSSVHNIVCKRAI